MIRSSAGGLGSEKASWRDFVLPRWRASLPLKPHPTGDEDQARSTLPGVSNSINDLPVEILQHIFMLCAEPRPPNQNPFPQVYPEWIAITYVSRYWRALALNHRCLWAPVDAELRVGQATVKRICLCIDEVIGVLAGCTRLRSLRLVGPRRDVCAVLDELRTPTPLRSLTLSLWERGPPVMLPEGLFGGDAPIRYIHFTADRCIVAPPHLLRGVTHFTSGEQIPLPYLLDTLRQMPALTHFTLQHGSAHWLETDVPRDMVIDMPRLTNSSCTQTHLASSCCSTSTSHYRKAQKGIAAPHVRRAGWDRWARWFATFPSIIEAANGLQYAYLSGRAKAGTFRVWTGPDPVYEEAEFYLDMYWHGSPTNPPDTHPPSLSSPMFYLPALCDILGTSTRVRNLELEGLPELPSPFWWELLQKLQAVEQLDIHSNAMRALYTAWNDVNAPAVLPAIQRVRPVRTDTGTPTPTTVDHGAALRGSFIFRIIPSRSLRPSPPAHAVPMTHQIGNGHSSASEPLEKCKEKCDETALGFNLITLLHGGR
ncbi:hypothetical protein EI94DRAFT_1325273 [Lactarius quietus]|nr:hypothetical protein EI94DRAFT_1325273 [Lactarius quietus]